MASLVYVLNDLLDAPRDRMHKTKKNRPIASGRISAFQAIILIAALGAVGGTLLVFSANQLNAILFVLVYLLLNIAYCVRLKNVAIVDLFILASGFVLRIYYGSAWFLIPVSPWLFLCILSGALCFATGKRRNEIRHANGDFSTRPVLALYNMAFLTNLYYFFWGITIVFFSLWTIFVIDSKPVLQYTIPVVIFIMMRYSLLLETTDADGDPLPTLLKDKWLIGLLIAMGIMCLFGIYAS